MSQCDFEKLIEEAKQLVDLSNRIGASLKGIEFDLESANFGAPISFKLTIDWGVAKFYCEEGYDANKPWNQYRCIKLLRKILRGVKREIAIKLLEKGKKNGLS